MDLPQASAEAALKARIEYEVNYTDGVPSQYGYFQFPFIINIVVFTQFTTFRKRPIHRQWRVKDTPQNSHSPSFTPFTGMLKKRP